MTRQKIRDLNPEAILLDNSFDQAIVGVGSNGLGSVIAIYSLKDCVDIISSDGVDEYDAVLLMKTFMDQARGKYSPVLFTELWEIS